MNNQAEKKKGMQRPWCLRAIECAAIASAALIACESQRQDAEADTADEQATVEANLTAPPGQVGPTQITAGAPSTDVEPYARILMFHMEKQPIPLSALRELPEYEIIKYRFLKDSVTSAHLTQLNETLSRFTHLLIESNMSSKPSAESNHAQVLEKAAARAGRSRIGAPTALVFEETETLNWGELEEWINLSRSVRSHESKDNESFISDVDNQFEYYNNKTSEYEAELLKIDQEWYEHRHQYLKYRAYNGVDGELPRCEDFFEGMDPRCKSDRLASHTKTTEIGLRHAEDFQRIHNNLIYIYYELYLMYDLRVDRPGYEHRALNIFDWKPSEVREEISKQRHELSSTAKLGQGGSHEYTKSLIDRLWGKSPNDQLIASVSVRNSSENRTLSVHYAAKLEVTTKYNEAPRIVQLTIDDYENNTTIDPGEMKVFKLRSEHLSGDSATSKAFEDYGSGAYGAKIIFEVNFAGAGPKITPVKTQQVPFSNGSHSIHDRDVP